MRDLSKCHNPYDFANPVADRALFVGRRAELDEITYYLNHAGTAPRPINIALLGERASGKTSLLNMTERMAKERGFCTVRIDLNENDVQTHLGFFFKLFDGVLSSACDVGGFGGKLGKTYDIYLDMTNAYSIPDDKTFCPFFFPIQYAKAMAHKNPDALMSDNNYRADLLKISREIGHPIVVLFDEGNVLAKSRTHLERLRNLFMNTPGYMLVITGTPDLFPVMDDVFSPIVRQFKKITIAEFKDETDTKACIKAPLETLGIRPEEVFDFESFMDVSEIHDVSGGRPYEIQLICHIMFRRIQEKRAKKMKLDLSVLEDVRRELETSQDISARPILTTIRGLKRKQLSALRLFCACDGCANIDQIWSIEYIFSGETIWTRDTLESNLRLFVNEGVLTIDDDGKISFAGDDFDKIYAKYFAREQRVPFNFMNFPLELFWAVRLRAHLKDIDKLQELWIPSEEGLTFSKLHAELCDNSSQKDVLVENPPIIGLLYKLMILKRERETFPIIEATFALPWLNATTIFYSKGEDDELPLGSLQTSLVSLKRRMIDKDGDLSIDKAYIPVIPLNILINKVERTENEKMREQLAEFHASEMATAYLAKHKDEALFHARLSQRYSRKLEPSFSNNVAYVLLANNELDGIESLLKWAIDNYEQEFQKALPFYNLGILFAKQGNHRLALENISKCIENLANTTEQQRQMACLLVLKVAGGALAFEESWQPNLLDIAEMSRKALESHMREL